VRFARRKDGSSEARDPTAGSPCEEPGPDALARLAAQGDREAFRGLVNATQRLVYRVALRWTGDTAAAEDVVQETFARAWLGLARGAPEAAAPWLCTIARNAAVDRGRARRPELGLGDLPDPGSDPQRMLEAAERDARVRSAVEALPPRHRAILLLREVDGLSYDELSVALGIRPGTVESRLFRARAALARTLDRMRRRDEL
jgi:RNA polymerase sigma-70 factor (ECF subfamily)